MGASEGGSFGIRLRRLRETAGLTQEQLAECAGLTVNGIGQLERGERRRPYPATVQALADALGLTGEESASLIAAVPPRTTDEQSRPDSAIGAADALPVPPAPLVGREREVTEVCGLLRRDDARLVTLSGPGGVGKTRLAIAVATVLADAFADGVVFVPLAPIMDPALVASTVAQALRLREAGDQPLAEQLRAFLRTKRLLLVLDNFEQVVDAAPFVSELLGGSPGLRELVTSRAALRVSGERMYVVQPLAGTAAVRLFAERAEAAKVDFALTEANSAAVTEVCRTLDGLPLAIELAAARANVLSPQAMLARLERRLPLLTGGPRDQPARQRTLHATVAWSYDLLEQAEQMLFRHLAVFAGGFTLEAAETVAAGEGDPGSDLLDGVTSLVDKSLLRPLPSAVEGEPRFGMLETIRDFGLEQLETSGEAKRVRQAHAACFTALTERLLPDEAKAVPDGHLDRLHADLDNLRAALAWLDQVGDAEACLQLAQRLWLFWRLVGHLAEGRRWLERSLARWEGLPLQRADILYKISQLAYLLGDDEGSVRSLEAILAIAQDRNDTHVGPLALTMLGAIARGQGRYDDAERLLQESLRLLQRSPAINPSLIGDTLRHLGLVAYGKGDLVRAAELCDEALRLARADEDTKFIAYVLASLSLVACARSDYPGAAAMLTEGLDQLEAVGDLVGLPFLLADTAVVAEGIGAPERAACLFGAVATLHESSGGVLTLPGQLTYERSQEAARAALGEAAFAAAWDAGGQLSPAQAVAEARAFLSTPAAMATPAADRRPAAESNCGLTLREQEVLRLAAAGLTNAQIADRLFLSAHTVRAHLHRIYHKLDLANRAEAVRFALEHGLA